MGAPLVAGSPAAEPDSRVQEVLRMAYSTPLAKAGNQPALVAPRPVAIDPAAEARKLDLAAQFEQRKRDQAAAAEQQRLAEQQAAEKKAAEQRAAEQQAAKQKAAAEKAARGFVRPVEGRLTSTFGARWGTTHYGIDIANSIGTPIVSVAAGTVIEAGPASGFGLWVRVQHDDGTVTIYGHVNEIIAKTGTRVTAGQKIATVGNRGQSTGPHLHFEVWLGGSKKTDPIAWLRQRGVGL
ncbi:M23 family metallopeptidase [Alloactinosynnema sp. L-07]|uniref:M23 family metallopeptidase n=1 Tax=Alloactinosynnema sp. L-07 TaxID=1653480 RepID=UPI001E581AD0|nr:M23 family metallopeptidase [Alloactinosynnema sp. L-07]